MVKNDFNSRVKIQQIIASQLPEFILDENPKASEFLKQYYISQEYQGGPADIVENLDQYINLDSLIPEVIVGSVVLTKSITTESTTIDVESTKGFPSEYGLLKIDDEIITYTGSTETSFTGCIRGFSGITNYHENLKYGELVFSESSAQSHNSGTQVNNLSSLFLQEFYKKIKFSLTPGLEGLEFIKDLNVGNFIKEAKTLYGTKGTEESFRILFNILFGETPSVIDLERYLIKPSDARFIRRNVAVIDVISGNPNNLSGQTIKKSTDENTSASVSEVETITRKGKTYYKLNFFVGYDETYPNIVGSFSITPNTRLVESVVLNNQETVITVDSTIGFKDSGSIFYDGIEIFYTEKTINQFLGCYINLNETINIPKKSKIISSDTYYGYENGDVNKKVEFTITGVLSNINLDQSSHNFVEGEEIYPQNLGKIIPKGSKKNEIFANTWIYNTSSRYQLDSFSSNTITTKSLIDSASLSVGDKIEFLKRNTEIVVSGFDDINVISIFENEITIDVSTSNLNVNGKYDIRRKIKKASSSIVPIQFGNEKITSDVQNVYDENSNTLYVASNSIPSYPIQNNIFEYEVVRLLERDDGENYSVIDFGINQIVSFTTGDKIYYYTEENNTIEGLNEGAYYVEVLKNIDPDINNRRIRLYLTNSTIGTDNYVSFGRFSDGNVSGIHKFTLYSQRSRLISPQKLLKKFKLNQSIGDDRQSEVKPGPIGLLKNGVEIYTHKTNDKIYYGPLSDVNVLNGGSGYDVINPPLLTLSTGNALVQPVINGSVEKIFVDPQEFDVDVVVSVKLSGGNGSGASFQPIIEKYAKEIEFDARIISEGGGLDIDNERIVFLNNHNLVDGQPIIYYSNNYEPIGIGDYGDLNLDQSKTLVNGAVYYTKVINDKTIELYQSFSDYSSGINTVGFTTIGNNGLQKFKVGIKNKLSQIKVINGGSGYTNRKLRVKPIGISTYNHTIEFNNHGFSDGEIVNYSYEISGISGLSTSTKYKILKVNSNSFRLCDAGVDGTDNSNYQRKKYVKFSTVGSGYQIFTYPDITLSVDYTSDSSSNTLVQGSIIATPVVRGKIEQVYVYENGSDYGSLLLNTHKRPRIIVNNGKEAQLKPLIKNGKIIDVIVLYGGQDYYSIPNLIVSGSGIGASFRPVVSNNKIVDVIVTNSGIGYDDNTVVRAVSAGNGAVFQANVRSLTINRSYKYGIQKQTYRDPATEILIETDKNLEYAVVGYSDYIKNNINDIGSIEAHSDIIGWAYDGNPIYGSYGYSDIDNPREVKKLKSGYSLVNIENRPPVEIFPIDYFVEDYEFTNSGDLDQYNGRFGKTKDFPEGIYAYFATIKTNNEGNIVGEFPYFIGNEYRSQYIDENTTLDQSFNFNNSSLSRNTLPYKVNDEYADNDFIVESNEIIEQRTLIESVSSGSVSSLRIINSGSNYNVNDELIFDSTESGYDEVIAKVSEVKGEQIENIDTTVQHYTNSVITWVNGSTIRVNTLPYNNFLSGDNINISGLSNEISSLNGSHKIGIVTYSTTLNKDIPHYVITGKVTDIYPSSIPESVSIGSSIKIDNEILSVLNIFKNFGVIRVLREENAGIHTQKTPLYFLQNSFTINKSIDYFDSKVNDKVYFNPVKSVGIGTTIGSGVSVEYNTGITTYNTFIPSQSIFIPNHPFITGQQVVFKRPFGANPIAVSNTPTSQSFNILFQNSETLYVIKKSKNYIGIVTNASLINTTNGLFFRNLNWFSAHDNYEYSIESNYNQITADVSKINSVVSVSTSHNLSVNDKVTLDVKLNSSVGIGTTNFIKIKLNPLINNLVVNPVEIDPVGINTLTNQITIYSHNFNTGDKILYEPYDNQSSTPEGIDVGKYYVYKVDNDNIKLCETYFDSISSPPITINISTSGIGTQSISLINPQIKVFKNNDPIFDLSDPSLLGYNLKFYYDQNFSKEFISVETSGLFPISGVGTVGLSSDARLTLDYSDSIPEKLYYNIENSDGINLVDFDVNNYCALSFVDSEYNGTYDVVGVANTTFTISLKKIPELLSYTKDDCDILSYTTNSKSAFGGISKVNIISGGYGYKSLPVFKGVTSKNGEGAIIIPESNTIGNILQSRIINEGFEYSSDKTLNPSASIPKSASISSSNTIDTITILDGGQDYTSAPNLILVNSDSGEIIDSGFLEANLTGSSIGEVKVAIEPKGLPNKPVTIRSINNSNSISIDRVISSDSGIVTCILTTPLVGFTLPPFSVGDKIFVEGIEKYGSLGSGFNSSDYGYQFFTVEDYFDLNPNRLVFNISGLTTNPGIAKTIQESYAKITNYKNYPKFKVIQKFSPFLIGETLSTDNGLGFISRDLIVTECNENFVRVSGDYDLSPGEKIKGLESSSEATVDLVKKINGIYDISYFNLQNFGWNSETGKLNENFQVLQDNDYYQNLSYTVKSTKTWEEIVTPVNNLLHTSGTKNFSDTQFEENVTSGIGTGESSISLINMFVDDRRVDTISNFDLVNDIDISRNRSKFIKFKNIRLSDYVLCKTNRVLQIDDISSEFSSYDDERENVSNIFPIIPLYGYNKFLIQIKNNLNNETQFSEIITINNDEDIFTLHKADITTGTVSSGSSVFDPDLLLANIEGYVTDERDFYLRFEPSDPFDSDFSIKILHDTFTSRSSVGSTQSLNCVDLISQNKIFPSGITTSIFELDSEKYSAVYSNIHILNEDSSVMNYFEIYISHDGTNTYMSEYYFDDNKTNSYNPIGSFGASLSDGILSLNYTNTESENIIVRTKNVGFGSTSLGGGFYRFKLPGQIDSTERTIVFESNYNNISTGSTSIITLNKYLFTSIKSIIKVGLGETTALHQVMTVYDGSDVRTLQYPFLSIGSTSGIGSFGATIDENNIMLNFYPDNDISGNMEIISFNECFYTDLDVTNIPPDLNYPPIRQSTKIATYFGVNSPFINKLDFDLNYNDSAIFMKTFDPGTSINFETGVCTIPNHFFNTGEELIYRPKSTFIGIGTSAVEIEPTENHVGIVTSLLPETVYAIRIDNNSLKIATKKEYAEQGIGVTFTSIGLGNAHELEMTKKNEKSLITINNLAQHPISYSNIDHSLSNNDGQLGLGVTIFSLSGISSINPTDLLKIDDEYVRVENVGLGTTNIGPITFTGNIPLVEVTRGFVGSKEEVHIDTTPVSVYRGSYNISGNKIYFTQPPRGNQLDLVGPDENSLTRERANFTGRVFLRQDYTSNQMYDDISEQFTGIGQTFTLTYQGNNIVGLGTSGGNGIVLINSIFQSPTTLNNSGNNYIIEEDLDVGITTIKFTGIRTDSGLYISEYDINMNQLPRGGIIVSLGSTPGLGYAPLVGASVTAVIGAGGSIISVGLGTQDILGSGYRGNVPIKVTEDGHVGSVANISASVGAGGTLSFTVIDGGSDYSNPIISIPSPSYENLSVTGVSRLGIGSTTDTGIGLLLNVEVGASSTTGIGSTYFEVVDFKITRNGYGFLRGDVFKPVGLVTDSRLTSPISEFELSVLDTFTDSFAAWQFGELDYIDSVKDYQDGERVRFPLFYKSELLSFEIDDTVGDSQLIDLDSVLLIFINGILQEPGKSYQFNGGTSFVFSVPPKEYDDIHIFFYRGTRGIDSTQEDVLETIKVGDTVQIFSNNGNIDNTVTQDKRIVYAISSSDKIETNLYNSKGIDIINEKPVYWTKQKVDLMINGDIISKSRDSLESQIYPTANIIRNFGNSDNEIFLDNSSLFNYENESDDKISFNAIIFNSSSISNFSLDYEILSNIKKVYGFESPVVGIGTTTGVGTPLAITFTLDRKDGLYQNLQIGYPIYISNTIVGNGVTSIDSSDNDIVAISTSYLNNVYKIHAFDSLTGIITCNIHSNTEVIGIATTGTRDYPVGKMSWGRLTDFERSENPISIDITGYTSSIGINSGGYSAGLSTYPIIQRRGFGLRDIGPLRKDNIS